jgi:hypothetical protein
MATMFTFTGLAITTLLATGAAFLLAWVLLRAAFHLMRPAPKRAVAAGERLQLIHGTRQLVRAYGTHR